MEYKMIGETYYVRMDRGDEIISNILEICRNAISINFKRTISYNKYSAIAAHASASARAESDCRMNQLFARLAP